MKVLQIQAAIILNCILCLHLSAFAEMPDSDHSHTSYSNFPSNKNVPTNGKDHMAKEEGFLFAGNCTDPIVLLPYEMNDDCSITNPLIEVSGNLDTAFEDDCNALCGLPDNPTVWYELPIEEDADVLDIGIEGQGFNATWGVYESCSGSLISGESLGGSVNCGDESLVGGFTIGIFTSGLPDTVYIAVSATDDIYDGSYMLTYYTYIDCIPCSGDTPTDCDNGDYLITADEDGNGSYETFIPNDGTGTLSQNTAVEICFQHIYDTSATGDDWIQGLVPTFGNGWDLSTSNLANQNIPEFVWYDENDAECYPRVTEDMPNLCTYVGNDGALKLCNVKCQTCPCENGPVLISDSRIPSGWFATTPACGGGDCPYEEFGLSGGTQFTFSFCFEAKTKMFDTVEEFEANNDLTISFHTFSDGVTGCWEDPYGECIVYPAMLSPSYNLLFYPKIAGPVFDFPPVCLGDDGIATIVNSEDYTLIRWDLDGSTGSTYTINNLQMDTSFTITLTDINGLTTEESVAMTVNDNPQPAITGSLTYCSGSVAVLGLTESYVAYDWSTGSANPTVMVNSEGPISVTVTDDNGCIGSTSVNVIENSSLSIPGNSISICDDGISTATFDAGDSNDDLTFVWDENAIADGITEGGLLTTSVPNTYSVTVTDGVSSCTGVGVFSLTLDTQPVVALTTADSLCNDVTVGNTIINLGAYIGVSDAGVWLDDAEVFGGDFDPVSVNFDGFAVGEYTFTYQVESNGECPGVAESLTINVVDCVSFDCPELMADLGDPCDDGNPQTEDDIILSGCICSGEMVLSTQSLSGATVNIYPNPVSEILSIDVLSQMDYQVTLFRLDGQIVHQATNASTIRVSDLSSGVYILKVNMTDALDYICQKIIVED